MEAEGLLSSQQLTPEETRTSFFPFERFEDVQAKKRIECKILSVLVVK